MTYQITSLRIVYSTAYSRANQRKHQSSASLASVRGIHRWPVNFPHKGPVTRKMFPFDDVIMFQSWIIHIKSARVEKEVPAFSTLALFMCIIHDWNMITSSNGNIFRVIHIYMCVCVCDPFPKGLTSSFAKLDNIFVTLAWKIMIIFFLHFFTCHNSLDVVMCKVVTGLDN